MKKVRDGFTMIELIFVIVIIGILAVIALPKLAGTRTDAKVSTIIANTKALSNDIHNFYTSQGETIWSKAKIADVTDVPLQNDKCELVDPNTTDIVDNTFYICGDDGSVVKIITRKTLYGIENGDDDKSLVAKTVQNDKVFISLRHKYNLGNTTVKK